MEMRVCSTCKEVKQINDFNKNSNSKDGLQAHCKDCHSSYSKKWRASNPDYSNEYRKANRRDDSLSKLTYTVRSNIRHSFKRACDGVSKEGTKTQEILGCDFKFFLEYMQSRFTEGMTLENHGEWHLDHIIPLATAVTREDVVRLNHYTNFQPLWAKDNLSKGAKLY